MPPPAPAARASRPCSTVAVVAHQARGQADAAPASRRLAPRGQIAAVLAMLASAQLAAATLTVRQAPRAGAPVAGSMMWCICVSPSGASADRRAGGRETAACDRDRLSGRVGRAAVVVGDMDPPARRSGAVAGGGNVAAEADQRAAPGRARARRRAARSAAHAFAVAPRSSLTPAGTRTRGARCAVDLRSPAIRARSRVRQSRPASR